MLANIGKFVGLVAGLTTLAVFIRYYHKRTRTNPVTAEVEVITFSLCFCIPHVFDEMVDIHEQQFQNAGNVIGVSNLSMIKDTSLV